MIMKSKLAKKDLLPKYKLDIKGPYSYRVIDLFERQRDGLSDIVDYDVKLTTGKALQRDFVWGIEQKRSLILSIIKGLNVPPLAVVIYRLDDNKQVTYKIVDGKQRLRAIEEFQKGLFGIIHNGIEYFIDDLEEYTKHSIKYVYLSFNVIWEYQDARVSDEQLISWFELVNFAGTPQDIEHLNELYKEI